MGTGTCFAKWGQAPILIGACPHLIAGTYLIGACPQLIGLHFFFDGQQTDEPVLESLYRRVSRRIVQHQAVAVPL